MKYWQYWITLPIRIIILIPCLIIFKYVDSKFFCNFMYWHKHPNNGVRFNGHRNVGECPICNKPIYNRPGSDYWCLNELSSL